MSVKRDAHDLFEISHAHDKADQLWRYMPQGPFAGVGDLAAFYHDWSAKSDVIAFTARATGTQRCLGTISLMNIRPAHGAAELGNIWYAPEAQRTKTNTEASYLLLQYCFECLHYRRMEWKCDAQNDRSREAAQRLGFAFEGIFRQHMIIKGRNRDTAWFAMLDHEWPSVGAAMSRWLYEDDSASLGEQIVTARERNG